jgi:hypothetical protein
MKPGLVAMMLMVVAATAQTSKIGTTAGTGQAGQAATTQAVQIYSNPELHLTFSYPAELAAEDGAAVAAVGRRMIYGADEESSDPDHPKPDTCTHVLLSMGKGGERSGKGAWVRVGLLEVNAGCFPEKVFRNKKAVDVLLRNLVKQGTTVMGMMPLEQPAAYEIEGRRASFCAAQGQPVTGNDLQTAGDQLLGVVAMAVEGHAVAWVLETNDAATFNRLLGSDLDFGTGKPQRLFPAEVRGQGIGNRE